MLPLRPNPPSIKGVRPERHEAFVGLTVHSPFDRIHAAVDELPTPAPPVA